MFSMELFFIKERKYQIYYFYKMNWSGGGGGVGGLGVAQVVGGRRLVKNIEQATFCGKWEKSAQKLIFRNQNKNNWSHFNGSVSQPHFKRR